MANDDYGVDIWTQWAFAGLAIGLTMTLHLAITTWKCQQNGLSSTSSFTSWRMRFDDGDCWMHTALPIYMIHQFEEHGVDMLGRRYSFQKALCQAVSSQEPDDCPATSAFIFFVNVGTVWIGGLLARTDALGAGLNFYGTMTINALVHLLSFVGRGLEYNPGLLTSVVLFLPASYMAARIMLASNRCEDSDIARALLIGLAMHVVIIVSLLGAKGGYLSEGFVCFIQLLNIVPLLFR